MKLCPRCKTRIIGSFNKTRFECKCRLWDKMPSGRFKMFEWGKNATIRL